MYKVIAGLFSVIVIIFAVTTISNQLVSGEDSLKVEKYQELTSHVKFVKIYEDFKEIELDSKLVVIGKKIGSEPVFIKDDSGETAIYYTLSDFSVEKVLKNETGNEVKKKSEITIMENAAIDEVNKISYSVEGYKLMKDNKRYILFLTPNRTEEGVYNAVGVVHGKYAFEKNKSARDEQFDKDTENYEDELKNVNKKVYSEIEEKYKVELN
ncbi:hypothetical protein [Mangrovibacillus cuniculi]|uniref:Uncharacterized protein n=1 Tax=Mangrovibacillus cuniculi TaxID=2593652 RepID=A0A7S8HEL0_9BACI|nr:hypothetical protein [Mangrovibacillus cuniculi]QPC45606.1 hypothetical protein G8O30_00750 [Mangrovibacillus cuniculi]